MDTEGDDPMASLIGHSVTYRIATGPRQGRKVLTLQSLPAIDEPFTTRAGNVAGFSLHAGVAARANERDKLECLCRYITRPAVSEKRLSLTEHGQVRYTLKNPWRDGTTHVIFEPLDFIARLAALVPKPRVNLTRFHGIFAPNSQHRALITPPGVARAARPPPMRHKTEPPPSAMPPCRHDMGATPQARVQYRHHHVPELRRRREGHCLHRRSVGHPQDPRSLGQDRTSHTTHL
jgi:hypothetical protein